MQTLAGHSLAGYFTLKALQISQHSFQQYIALSPSLWSEPELIDAFADMQTNSLSAKVFLGVGQWEEELAPWQIGQPGSAEILDRRQQRGMVSRLLTLADVLQKQLGQDNCHCQVFPEEDHASVFAIGMSRSMRMMLAPPTL